MVNDKILEWPAGRLDFSAGCVVMGILNVTPDSFSDGGLYDDVGRAVAHGVEMAGAGAAIIDVGAESTRPGSAPVPADEQIKRAIPVIEKLSEKCDAVISIDTSRPDVAQAAIEAGASMINDITAAADDGMAKLAGQKQLPIVLMHMQGGPADMQDAPCYDDVVAEVLEFLGERAKRAESFGVAAGRIFIDPGIGFGKTTEHNLSLLGHIDRFVATGYRVLTGTSRKRFIGQITGKTEPADRVFGTAATAAICAHAGVSVVRVHDVPQIVDTIKIANAIKIAR